MNPRLKVTIVLVFAMGLLWATGANAQFLTVLNSNVPAGFGQAGYIQTAPLGSDGGGTLTMNGITMIVPANSVVQFPANTLQWADLFDFKVYSPVYDTTGVPIEPNLSITSGTTGLALLDNAAQSTGLSPYLPFNANVLGNIAKIG